VTEQFVSTSSSEYSYLSLEDREDYRIVEDFEDK